MSTRKYKKVNALAKAKILTYVAENFIGTVGDPAKDCLRKTPTHRRKEYQVIGAETDTSPYSIEFGVKRISDQVYKELHGDYPAGTVIPSDHKPVKWHKEMAESIVEAGLVK